jgi:uncharacterized protein (TIGR03435 family)
MPLRCPRGFRKSRFPGSIPRMKLVLVASRIRRVASLVALVLGVVAGCHAQSTKKLEFEVGSVKPSPSPAAGSAAAFNWRGGPGTNDPELFTCRMNLGNLIIRAYGVERFRLLSVPDWAWDSSTLFEISARIPPGATRDDFNVMLQNLLADRLKLAVHRESREMQQYDLVMAKNGPKFKEAAPPAAKKDDDAKRPPTFTPPKMGDDGYPVLGSTMLMIMNGRGRLHFPQITMGNFASALQAQLSKPVIDATGLTGKYDIGLYWDAGATGPLDAGTPGGAQTPVASDPGPTLVQAVQDQLGLRLEPTKGMVEFLVVDHAEKIPSEN